MNQRRKTKFGGIVGYALCVCAAWLCVRGVIEYTCPDVISVYGYGISEQYCTQTNATLTIGGLIPVKTVTVNAVEEVKLCPGGMLFGVRCSTDGVLVIGLEDVDTARGSVCPAKIAGVRAGDIITEVDGVGVSDASAVANAVSSGGMARPGAPLTLTVRRGEETLSLALTPCKGNDGVYRAGIWTRDATAGIGTVTFIDPETGLFGGLGHGICDAETGTLLPLARGSVLGVSLAEIVPGKAGVPGELRGCFRSPRTGTLLKNTAWGVFGVFSQTGNAAEQNLQDTALPIGHRADVHTGDAQILCSLDDQAPIAYSVKIVSVGDPSDTSNKNYVIEITDEALLAKTGGIVQGMSGSPVLQDGKLIGAVTHVMVNNPARGYGIFIENMLAQAADVA